MSSPVFLAVAGSIGSGKTTLTRRLVERLGFRGLYESTADNPYLPDFYREMQRWALPLQLRFLGHRVEQTRSAQLAGTSCIQDRTCYEDVNIFARHLRERGAMDNRDWETYQLVARQLLDGLAAPNLLVYLRRSPASCARQIRSRGRDYEQAIPPGYLAELAARYDGWFDGYELGPKLLVHAEQHDFLRSEDDLQALVDRIEAALPQPLLPF
jgi:deoxyadenosine/deoxycytidine kinase